MSQALLWLLACATTGATSAPTGATSAPPAPSADEEPAASYRAVSGPWEDGGAYLALAAGPGGEVHAAWLVDGALRYARAGADGAWTEPEAVASSVGAGDGGQIRPVLALADSGPVLAFAVEDRPVLAARGAGGWSLRELSSAEAGIGALLDLAVVGGDPLVVWLDTRRDPEALTTDVYAWYRGAEELVYSDGGDGVCVCCRPAATAAHGQPAVAFRDAEGALREIRMLVRGEDGWADRGRVTDGGWSPGGCPADGPVFDGEELLVSDARDGARRVYRGDEVLIAPEGAHAIQPRVAGDALFWLRASEDGVALMLGEEPLVTAAGRLEPGDPVTVGEEVWISWDDGRTHAIAVRP